VDGALVGAGSLWPKPTPLSLLVQSKNSQQGDVHICHSIIFENGIFTKNLF
jgi:hypothetical protein